MASIAHNIHTHTQDGRRIRRRSREAYNVLCVERWSARRIILCCARDALTPNVTKSIPKRQQCALPRNSLRNFSRGRTRIDLRREKCSKGEHRDRGNLVIYSIRCAVAPTSLGFRFKGSQSELKPAVLQAEVL